MLVKSIIHSMISYTINIYSWSVALLRKIEHVCRNFIWTRDIHNRKLFMASWKKTCQSFLNDGLGLRSLVRLNEAKNLRLMWNLRTSKESWKILLKNRFIKRNKIIKYHIYSTIWTCIKSAFAILDNNSNWFIGNCKDIRFWSDSWCNQSFPWMTSLDYLISNGIYINYFVSEFIVDGHWCLPNSWKVWFPSLANMMSTVPSPQINLSDQMIWNHNV